MQRSVPDRRSGAGAVRFSHVDVLTELGIGIAIGMLAGTTGTARLGARPHDPARRGDRPDRRLPARRARSAPCSALVGAIVACLVVSDVISGAGRREGSRGGALGFLVGLAALVVIAISLLRPGPRHPRPHRPRLAGHLPPPPGAEETRRPARAALGRAVPFHHHSPGDARRQEARPHLRRLAADRHARTRRRRGSGADLRRPARARRAGPRLRLQLPLGDPGRLRRDRHRGRLRSALDQRHELVPPARAALRRVRLLARRDPLGRRLPRALRPRLQHEPRPPQPRGRDDLREPRRRRRSAPPARPS